MPGTLRRVYVIDGYRKSGNPTRRCVIDLGFDINGAWEAHLDQGSAKMILPMSFAADEEYLYVTYLDAGLETLAHGDLYTRGEVTIYDLKDGHEIGWLRPTQVTNFPLQASIFVEGINVQTLPTALA
ncbi:MAG: hypothetical protein IPP19_09330 [Verrucomicrobia bacterium]|nr:hypothetical protein [Verrucomicrobiota bacterium]